MNADKRMSAPARKAIASPENERTLSIAAAWEMAVKNSLGKLKLPLPFGSFLTEHLLQSRIAVIAITIRDLARVEMLPFHLRDPFDRLMAAQALERSWTFVSSNPVFEHSGVDRGARHLHRRPRRRQPAARSARRSSTTAAPLLRESRNNDCRLRRGEPVSPRARTHRLHRERRIGAARHVDRDDRASRVERA